MSRRKRKPDGEKNSVVRVIIMKVKVYAPSFCSFKQVDENGCMALPEDSTVHDVLERLRIPSSFQDIMNVSVNHEKAELSAVLKDGDVVSFHSGLWGG